MYFLVIFSWRSFLTIIYIYIYKEILKNVPSTLVWALGVIFRNIL